MALRTKGHWFIDKDNRRVLLRGVNLSGSAKIPSRPNYATHIPTDFRDHRVVSFVDRPFPLKEADEHYRRLRHWGFNSLRFITTWEAVEHAGPGEYDYEYLGYLHEVVRRAEKYGFYIFIDPHQDMWSRMSGGDGAPGWTLETVGFDLSKLDAAEAAITMHRRYPNYGKMVWLSNYIRLASATMFTLFFAGDRYAPGLKINGVGIQEYLQSHYIQAMKKVAEVLSDIPHILGYGTMNEPSSGYIGMKQLHKSPFPMIVTGPVLSGFQSMVIPSGYPMEVPYKEWNGILPRNKGTVLLNPEGLSAWRDPELDVWRSHGVWDIDHHGKPVLLQDKYFAGASFFSDHLKPFIYKYAEAIHQEHPDAIIFIEGEPISKEPMEMSADIPIVNASHWYDNVTLVTKRFFPRLNFDLNTFRIIIGARNVLKMFVRQIGRIVSMSNTFLEGVPTLIAEFGLPYDMNGQRAYETGDFSSHVRALSAYYDALDANLAHATQWNYTPDNSNQWGDLWNQEDLSIFSRDQQTNPDDINSGGRAIAGFCRPYVQACAGEPMKQSFNQISGKYHLEVDVDPKVNKPTAVYVPLYQYPTGHIIQVTSGNVDYDSRSQILRWRNMEEGRQKLFILRKPRTLRDEIKELQVKKKGMNLEVVE